MNNKSYKRITPKHSPHHTDDDDDDDHNNNNNHIHIDFHDTEDYSPKPNIITTTNNSHIPLSSRIQSIVTSALPSMNINHPHRKTHPNNHSPRSPPNPVRFTRHHHNSSHDSIPLQTRSSIDHRHASPTTHNQHQSQRSSSLESIYRSPNYTDAAEETTVYVKLYKLLEDPSSSRNAFHVSVFVSTVIVVATIVASLETIPALYSREKDLWAIRYGIELFIIITFTLEYVLRILSRSDSWQAVWRYLTSPLGIIDILAIVPYWVELASEGSKRPLPRESAKDAIAGSLSYVFRTTILKAFRLLSMFRVFRYSSLIQLSIDVLIIALRRSLDALSALVILTAIVLSLFSTLLFFAERGTYDATIGGFVDEHGRPSTFDSIPRSCWFVLSTLTTTGYGDMVPQTFAGKIITIPIMMCGVLLIALPSIVVGRNFAVVYEFLKARREGQMDHGPDLQQPPLENSTERVQIVSNAVPTDISPTNPLRSPLPGLASIFDDPFSHGATVAGPLPRDTQQLLTYVTAMSIAVASHQARLHEAINALKESIKLDQLLNQQESEMQEM